MTLRQISRRFSGFTYCKNPKIGVPRIPIEESVKTTHVLLHTYSSRRFHNSRGVGFALGFFGCGAVIGVFNGKWVTVPCAERMRFIPFYKFLHELVGEYLQVLGRTRDVGALPPFDPDCITARRIFQDIIREALPQETELIRRPIVVDSPLEAWALSLRHCRTTYVSSGLIRLFPRNEAMIATTIGREVGHDLAGHLEEVVSKTMSSVSVVGTSLYLFSQSTYIRSKFLLLDKFMRLPLLPSVSFLGAMWLLCNHVAMKNDRKMQMEADYIGLMLASSAGYDPREGIQYLVHAANNGTLRSRSLGRPQVINKALHRYHRAKKPPNDDDIKESN